MLLALDDSPAFAAAFWGAARLGAVSVPVNTLMTADEYAFVLNDSRARVAVVTREVAPLACSPSATDARGSGPCSSSRAARPAALDWDEALARAKPVAEPARTCAEDVVYWGYTSGSTGRAQGGGALAPGLRGRRRAGRAWASSASVPTISSSRRRSCSSRSASATRSTSPRAWAPPPSWCPSGSPPSARSRLIAAERPTVFFDGADAVGAHAGGARGRAPLRSLLASRYGVSSGEALPPRCSRPGPIASASSCVEVVGSTEALHDFIANRPGEARARRRAAR